MATEQGAILRPKADIDISELNQFSLIAFYFDIITEHSVSLNSQITDNWMENNTVINDHIANQPLVVSLRGLKGELKYTPSDENTLAWLSMAESHNERSQFDKLRTLTNLYPPVDNLTQLSKNAADASVTSTNRYASLVKNAFLSDGQYNATFGLLDKYINTPLSYEHKEAAEVFHRLETMRLQKMSFEVETPWQTFKNMYIQSLTFRQGNQLFTTDIEVSLKQVYYTNSLTTKADKKVLADISAAQRAEIENQGKTQGQKKSLAAKLYDGDDWNLI